MSKDAKSLCYAMLEGKDAVRRYNPDLRAREGREGVYPARSMYSIEPERYLQACCSTEVEQRNHLVSALLDVALGEALVDADSQVGGDGSAELLDVLAIEGAGEAEGGVDDVLVEAEEVLGDLAGTGVGLVEGRDEGGRLAVVVDLVVDGADGEDGALELLQRRRNLHGEAVLEDEAGIDGALDDSEELSGARVGVRGVDAAGSEEGDGRGDIEIGQDGEVGDVGSLDSAAGRLGGVVVEVKDNTLGEGIAAQKLAVGAGEEELEAVDSGGSTLEAGD
jgi:hypothetical protein